MVKNFIIIEKMPLICHPPYSPVLAPCDFWLFNYVMSRLEDFVDAESLKLAVTEVLENIPHEDYVKTFSKWKERIELCLKHKGEYFEHHKL